MSGCFCARRKEGDGDGWQQQVLNKLAKVESLFPGTNSFVIVSSGDEPQVVFAHPKKNKEEFGEFVQICDRLKFTMDTFAGAIGEEACPTLHIRGDKLLFSCYSVSEQHYLVFFSEVGDLDEYAVTINQDDRIQELCGELRPLLDV